MLLLLLYNFVPFIRSKNDYYNLQNEDLTEEILVNRHEKCEQEEKKKFSTYLKLPNSMARPRGQRRADSRAESSGGNTPGM
jgi:KAT8 regulatory NSL complex subunit 1